MRFWVLGLAVVLAAQLAASSLASLLAAWAYSGLRARLARLAPGEQARHLLTLALFPLAAGLLAAGLAALAWLAHEPRSTDEAPGPVLLALALAGLAVVTWRAGSAGLDAASSRRLVARFRREGRGLAGFPLPALQADHPFPVAALAGVWRPRLLIADRVLKALQPAELDAVVAHELAHLEARDNLKRLLLAASPDPLALTGAGRRLRSEFLAAAEAAADARACVRVSPTTLARAIVKVAGLVPAGARLDLRVASFHHDGSLAARVRALVEEPVAASAEPTVSRASFRRSLVIGAALAATLAAALAGADTVLAALHGALERLVHFLA